VSDPAHGDGALAHVAQPLVDQEFFFPSDPQRLIEVAAAYQDVGDPAHGDGALARVAQPLEDWKQVFSENPQRLTCTSSMALRSDLTAEQRAEALRIGRIGFASAGARGKAA